jgi:hypothetical protein
MSDYSRQYLVLFLDTFPVDLSIYVVLDNDVWQDEYTIDNGAVLRVYLNMDN